MDRKSNSIAKLVAMAAGLALLDLWGDLKGSSIALLPMNNLVSESFLNGRIVGLAGISACCIAAVVCPRLFFRGGSKAIAVFSLLGALLSTLFLAVPGFGAGGGAIAVVVLLAAGICYGYYEIKILGAVCRCEASFSVLILVLVFSLALKCALLSVVCALPVGMQAVAFCASPLLIGCCLVACNANAAALPNAQRIDFSSVAIMILILFSVLAAAARTIGTLGFWGEANLMDGGDVWPSIMAALFFMLVAYVGFKGKTVETLVAATIKLLLVLLVGFVVFNIMGRNAEVVPEYISSTLDIFMDLYAILLLRAVMLVTARTTAINPYSAVGLGDAVMCLSSIVFGLVLSFLPEMQDFIVLFAVFATAVCALLMLEKTVLRKDANNEPANLKMACESIALECELTPRELDVLSLLAQGRSQSYIAEAFTVAPSTVKTHVKHVYQKMGISNKQELITIIQQKMGKK